MELLNRYLSAVAIRLPKAQRADIESELRDTLLSRLQERSIELGRVLTTKEVESLLRAYGDPLLVAGRYRSRQQLISLDTYPYYMFALQMVLGAQLIGHIVWTVLAILFGEDPVTVMVRTLSSLWIVSTYLLGVTTFSFVVLERTGFVRWLALVWSPRYLPKSGAMRAKTGRKLLLDCLLISIPALWAISGLHPSILTSHWPPSAFFRATPYWIELCCTLTLLTTVQLIAHLTEVRHPQWKRIGALANIAVGLGILVILGALLRDKPWITIAGVHPAAAEAIVRNLRVAIGTAIGMIAVVTVIRMFTQILRIRESVPVAFL